MEKQKLSPDNELLEFIVMRGLGFTAEELEEELDTVGSAMFVQRNQLREKFKSSEHDNAVEFLLEELE